MPRVTRSKKVEVAEDNTASPIILGRLPDDVERPSSLSEITSTNTMQESIAAELKGLKAAYRSAVGGGKKGGKRGRKQRKNDQEAGTEGEDGQDEGQAENTTAAISPISEVPRQLLQAQQVEEMRTKEEQIQGPVQTTRTTRRQAAQAEDRMPDSCKIMRNNTNRLTGFQNDTPVQLSRIDCMTDGTLGVEASAQDIMATSPSTSRSRSPAKTLAEVEASLRIEESGDVKNDSEEDSFIEHIIACSPAKHVSRIEDSVEALDQLEEAIEALDQAALTEKVPSPEKTRRKPVSQKPHTSKTTSDSKAFIDQRKAECDLKPKPKPQNAKVALPSRNGYASVRVHPTAPRISIIKKAASMVFKTSSSDGSSQDAKAITPPEPAVSAGKRPVSMINKPNGMETTRTTTTRRPVSYLPPKEIVKSAKPATKPSFELPGEAIARRLKEQRVARLALRESSEDSFQTARAVSVPKIKSTKPPTTSNFELPGEAVSRRKREANEARLKAQEEEDRKRREFKAKPLRKSTAPNMVPRDTVASRARQSKVGLENVLGSGSNTLGRVSNIGTHRPSLSQLVSANTSSPRAPGPAPQLTRQPSISTMTTATVHGSMQRTVSATEVMAQRQRAKEIYNRDVRLTEDIERERREREGAAKRAREEAAERGRQASREWAEKQMAKRLAVQDKNFGAAHGSGGQIGLKA